MLKPHLLFMSHELIIGVSGGIAAYKTAALVSSLVQKGHGVSVVMTRSARISSAPPRFAPSRVGQLHAADSIATSRSARTSSWPTKRICFALLPLRPTSWPKPRHGLADDLLSTLFLSFTGPIMFAPAMNSAMWEKPAVQRNIKTLRDDGHHIIDPQAGWQSCRRTGMGRMADPAEIQAAIERFSRGRNSSPQRH